MYINIHSYVSFSNVTTYIIRTWNACQDTAEGMLRGVLMNIFEIAGGPIDHVPPVMYEFEISCTKKADDREHFNTRVANMPTLINLSN